MDNLQKKRFETAKAQLNAAQKEAVEWTEGPVLVVAGPGTGKTQVLSLRICELLQQSGGITPYNILCLTYTDAAEYNMRKRLISFMGADAYKVQIFTYHSFCSQIIQYNPTYFQQENAKRLKPIDDLEYFDLMKELMLSLDISHPLKKLSGSLMDNWKALKELFSLMEKEKFDENFLLKEIDDFEQSIETPTEDSLYFYKRGPEKGKPKAKLQETKNSLQKLRSAIMLKKPFDKLLQEKGFYTFEQMISFVIDAFQHHHDLLLDYQERFQYILVDEYQDTNNAQNNLIFLLCQYWQDNPNLFVVGDDDQSIFRFQGANLENILQFREKFHTHLKEIRLDKNYRSAQKILDAAEKFIQNNQERLLPNKLLTAENSIHQSPGNSIYIEKYATPLDEEIGIAQHIKKLIDEEKCHPSEIAVLYTKHKHASRLQTIFNEYQIPYEFHASKDILTEPFIVQVLDVLLYFSRASDPTSQQDELLFHCLHAAFFGIRPNLLLQIFQKNDRKKQANLRLILSDIKSSDFPDFDEKEILKLTQLAEKIEKLFAVLHQQNIEYFVQSVFYELGIINFAHASKEKVWLLQQLYTFFDFIKNEHLKKPYCSLATIFQRINDYKLQQATIPVYRMIKPEPSVKLMTVFSSKGLEFEYVFMMKNQHSEWEAKKGNNHSYVLPKSVFKHQHILLSENNNEELRRLFYVGLTRAKKKVFLSFAETNPEKNKPLTMSQFVLELVQTGMTHVEQVELIPKLSIGDSKQVQAIFNLLMPPQMDEVYITIEAVQEVEKKLETFELSASSLNEFLGCPISFYYNYIVRLPRASSPNQAFGKSVHLALKKLYPDKRNHQNDFLSLNEFLNVFKEHLSTYQSHFVSEENFKHFLERGNYFLPIFYDKFMDEFKKEKITQNEYPINLVMDGVRVFGMLDKIVFNFNDVTIVDYKTGSFSYSKTNTDRFSPPNDKNVFGGAYWRQGAFYKMLVDNIHLKRPDKKWKTTNVLFQYIEAENQQFFIKEFTYSDEQMNNFLSIVKDIWNKIQQKEFTKGCGKTECQWCNFARSHQGEHLSLDSYQDE